MARHSAEQDELIYVSLMIIIGTRSHTRLRLRHSSSDSALRIHSKRGVIMGGRHFAIHLLALPLIKLGAGLTFHALLLIFCSRQQRKSLMSRSLR